MNFSCQDSVINQILTDSTEKADPNSNWNDYCRANEAQHVDIEDGQIDTRKKKKKNSKKKKRRLSNQKRRTINLHRRLFAKCVRDTDRMLAPSEAKATSNNATHTLPSIDPDDFNLIIDEIQRKKKEMLTLYNKVLTIEDYEKTFDEIDRNEEEAEKDKFRLLRDEINSCLAAYNREEYCLHRLGSNHDEKITYRHRQQHRKPQHASLTLNIEGSTEHVEDFAFHQNITTQTNHHNKPATDHHQCSVRESNPSGSVTNRSVVASSIDSSCIPSNQPIVSSNPPYNSKSTVAPTNATESPWLKYLRQYPT